MKLLQMFMKYKVIFNKEQKVYGFFILVVSFIGAVWETVGVSIIVPFTDVLLNPDLSYQKEEYRSIVGWFHLKSGEDLIVFLAIMIAILYVIKNLYFIFMSWVRAKYSAKIERELSIKVMENYMNRGYGFFTNTNTGSLLRSIQTDVTNANMFLFNAMKIVTDALIVIFIAIYIVFMDWQMALGVGTMSILCFLFVASAFSKINLKAGKDSRDYLAKSNQVLLQALEGIKEVLALKKEKFFVGKYRENFTKHMRANTWKVICGEIPAYIIEGSCVAVIFVIICVRVINGGVTEELLPMLATFVVAAFRILPSIGKLTSEYSALNYYSAGLNAVYDNFVELELVTDDVNFNAEQGLQEEIQTLEFEREIKICDVVFAYEENRVIDHLNMKIKKGEAIAFIGPSGSGKTTLSDIILGLLKPQLGNILVDDNDISLVPYSWSNMIGYVSQTMYLADETIRFNVAFGVEEKDIDDRRVWQCLEQAHIADYVSGLKDNIYTMVGDRGIKFSGGQRQRIAIARALYHSPQILILDEATSALDNETENGVMESIEELHGKITLIIIAHRLSTIRKCDRIYEIVNGIAIEKDKDSLEFK